MSARQLGSYDPRWYGDYRVSQDHHEGREELPRRSLRRYVTVTDSGQRNDRPIYAARYACKTVVLPFDHVNERTDDDNESHNGGKEHENLPSTRVQGLPQQQVSEILGMPLNTVKTQLRRARIELARGLALWRGTTPEEVSS